MTKTSLDNETPCIFLKSLISHLYTSFIFYHVINKIFTCMYGAIRAAISLNFLLMFLWLLNYLNQKMFINLSRIYILMRFHVYVQYNCSWANRFCYSYKIVKHKIKFTLVLFHLPICTCTFYNFMDRNTPWNSESISPNTALLYIFLLLNKSKQRS